MLLRRMLGTSVRTWLWGWAAIAVVVLVTATLERLLDEGEEYQYLGTVVATFASLYGWTAAGAVVGVTTPLRRRWPQAELVVRAALAATLLAGIAVWAWVLAIAIPSEL